MESTIVIKVKYGETLRRFNALVNEAGQLNLDMNGLREKVLGLFYLSPEADVTLTYIDEDGDVVTLGDEEDLRDVMRQSLNPVRIAVKLNAEKNGRSYTRSSGSSTPMISPMVQPSLPNSVIPLSEFVDCFLKLVESSIKPLSKIQAGTETAMKPCEVIASKGSSSLSDIAQFGDCFSKLVVSSIKPHSKNQAGTETAMKLCEEMALKGSSSLSDIAEFVDCFSKLAESSIKLHSKIQAGTESGTQSAASGSAMVMVASVDKEPEASKDDGAASEVMPNANGDATHETEQKVNIEAPRGVEPSFISDSSSLNLNALPGLGCANNEVASDSPASDTKEVGKSNEPWKSVSTGASASTCDSWKHSTMDFKTILNSMNDCPFSRMPVSSDSAVHSTHNSCSVPPSFKRSFNHNEGLGSIFHRGVRCDGCGVYPITGPRFKSKVKEDYDLCSICFSHMGNLADYIRMDRPVSYQHPHSWKGLCDPMQQPQLRSPTVPHVLRSGGTKSNRPKLDSCFICDVNIVDGTIMAPSTPFTKIWLMRNNGSIVWPEGTQLVWVGGDKLSNAVTVDLPIPSHGLPVTGELNVAVKFTAPELPGRCMSYWRMSSPYGKKFGQCIWVLIQVDASLCDSFNGLNLNLPPATSGSTGPEMGNVKVESMVLDDGLYEPTTNNDLMVEDLVRPIANSRPLDQDLNFPINDTLLVGGVSNPAALEAPSSVSYPIIDLSEVAPVEAPSVSYPVIDLSEVEPVLLSHVLSPSPRLPISSQGTGENNDIEQTLLKELKEMGFKQVDLNREILRINEYDLEQSVEDLCGVAESNPWRAAGDGFL